MTRGRAKFSLQGYQRSSTRCANIPSILLDDVCAHFLRWQTNFRFFSEYFDDDTFFRLWKVFFSGPRLQSRSTYRFEMFTSKVRRLQRLQLMTRRYIQHFYQTLNERHSAGLCPVYCNLVIWIPNCIRNCKTFVKPQLIEKHGSSLGVSLIFCLYRSKLYTGDKFYFLSLHVPTLGPSGALNFRQSSLSFVSRLLHCKSIHPSQERKIAASDLHGGKERHQPITVQNALRRNACIETLVQRV